MDIYKTFCCDDRESWTHLCKTLAGMTNLRKLYMQLLKTSTTYDDDHEEHWSGGFRGYHGKIFFSPRDPVPISEQFILDSLC